MKIKEIIDNKDTILQSNVFPNVLKNRFDVLHPLIENGGGYKLYCIVYRGEKRYIPVFFRDKYTCELGLYMRKIDEYLFGKFTIFLFKKYKKL